MRYEELRRRTEYSYLQAFGQLRDHVNRGRELGQTTLCVTDTATLRYAYDLQKAVFVHTPDGEVQPRPIYGAVVNVVDDHRQHGLSTEDEEAVGFGLGGRERQKAIRAEEARQQVTAHADATLRVMEGNGFRSLSRLTSIAWDNINGGCYRGIPRMDIDLLVEHNEGLSISFGGPESLLGEHIVQKRMGAAVRVAQRLAKAFKGRMYLELMPHPGPLHRRVNRAFIKIAKALDLPLIAVNDVHYVNADDTDAHTILLCLANKMTMEEPDHPRSPEGYHLRSADEMIEAFAANHPYIRPWLVIEAIENTGTVADAHTWVMEIDRFRALVPQVPHDSVDDVAELARLCAEGWKWRDIEGRTAFTGYALEDYEARLNMELDVELLKAGKLPIACSKFPGYFLIVRDLINWSRAQGIMTGPGRGSAAGSLVCYLLGITSLDPLEHGLLFARFISPARVDMPDIDMDFEDRRREEVITYLHDTYGHDKVGLICTVGRMKGKSALKDVGRVLGVPFGELNDVTGAIVERSSGDERASQTVADSFKEFKVCREFNVRHPHVLPLVVKLEGHARQPGVHAAGVITSPVKLPDVVPVETHMRNNKVVKLAAWDMYGVGGMGLLKLDVLGLRTLTVLNDARKMAEKRNPGLKLDYELLPLDDVPTLQAFTDHFYVGIFQYDSTGAHAACEGIDFDTFGDNVAMVALNRPGPARSGLATEFKKRKINPKRRDEQKVHPLYDSICGDSLGVLVYQEQVTKIFVQMAGYEPGTADSLRKVIAKKIGDETLKRERAKFVAGAVERGVPADVAEKIISDITFFGSYGFNKSHSAAYAIIGYWQMWMKVHYPAELMWALMQAEPKREQIARYAKEAQRLGVSVKVPDINVSGVGFAIDDDGDIVSNLTDIKFVGGTATAAIEHAQPFTDMVDFFSRVAARAVNSRALSAMIKAGAMRVLLPNTKIALESIKEKGSWLDIGRKQKKGWPETLRALIASWEGEEDYLEEDLLYLAGEVSPLGGGKHPMAVYDNLMSSTLRGCRFVSLDDPYFWNYKQPLIAGTMIDIRYNQVGDFDTVEPTEAKKRAMGWGKRYANVNIEDASGTQVRIKVHQDNFPEFRWILDQGIGTSMAMRLTTWKGVKAARALYVVDLESMRGKARHGLAFDGWERCLTDDHPAKGALHLGDVKSVKSSRRRKSFTTTGIIVGHKHIITKRTGQDMGFISLEMADHVCIDVTVFPDDYADWGGKLKIGSVVRLHLRNDKKSIVLGPDGVLAVISRP
jgi:DNA polymerase-3 subunit alpha